MKENPLIVALDVEPNELMPLVLELSPLVNIFKIGGRLFTAVGPSAVKEITKLGHKVFLDLKFHDIPLTVAESCRQAVRLGVWGITIHSSGGFGMMKEAVLATIEESKRLNVAKPNLFGVTVLTSMLEGDLKEIGVADSSSDQVKRLANLAKKAGLDGVVASGNEIELIRSSLGKDFLLVVPGIRQSQAEGKEDQKRVMTAKKAMNLGASFLVVGRPILQAKDRIKATKEILSEVYT